MLLLLPRIPENVLLLLPRQNKHHGRGRNGRKGEGAICHFTPTATVFLLLLLSLFSLEMAPANSGAIPFPHHSLSLLFPGGSGGDVWIRQQQQQRVGARENKKKKPPSSPYPKPECKSAAVLCCAVIAFHHRRQLQQQQQLQSVCSLFQRVGEREWERTGAAVTEMLFLSLPFPCSFPLEQSKQCY